MARVESAFTIALDAKVAACPLHGPRPSGLYHTRNSSGFYSTYAPMCNGCVVGAREMREFEVCDGVKDAVRYLRCILDDDGAVADIELAVYRLRAARRELVNLHDDSDMCLNALDEANATLAEAEAALAPVPAPLLCCHGCGNSHFMVHGTFGNICGQCLRDSS
jgi:hypothetical protein